MNANRGDWQLPHQKNLFKRLSSGLQAIHPESLEILKDGGLPIKN
ncbi:hypothetical protein [Polynucleobacter yangtzensis]|nr:hypothetical protein [Polynucleobacter yangtzensis]